MSQFKNDGFYADTVEKKLKLPASPQLMYNEYISFLENHLKECSQFIIDNPGISNVYVTASMNKDESVHLQINGQVPWSDKKIKEFNGVVTEEADDIKSLRKLLGKYPTKALVILAELSDNQ